MKLTIELEVPEQVLKDILTTCVENGSSYWLSASSIERDSDLNVLKIIEPFDAEENAKFDPDFFIGRFAYRDIDLITIEQGLRLLAQGALPGRDDLRTQIYAIPRNEHDFDASDCDIILQLGFFGQTVFG